MDEDEKWSASTAAHLGGLQRLAEEILAADARGECELLDPDKL